MLYSNTTRMWWSYGIQGPPGRDGINAEDGIKGDKEDLGLQGPAGPRNGGVVFTKWGCTTCPTINDTELLYKGKAARSLEIFYKKIKLLIFKHWLNTHTN